MRHLSRSVATGMLAFGLCCPALAQIASEPEAPAQKGIDDRLRSFSTLDAIRANQKEKSPSPLSAAAGSYSMGMEGSGAGPGLDAGEKELLLSYIQFLRAQLGNSKQNRSESETALRAALSEYFILDMEDRIVELDKIKSRVQQMEAKLKTRLDRRLELVDLQVKQMLHKADGLDFLVPEANRGYGQTDYAGYGSEMGGEGGGPPDLSGMGSPGAGMRSGGMGMGMGAPGGMGMGMGAPGGGMGAPAGMEGGYGSGSMPGMGMGSPGMMGGSSLGGTPSQFDLGSMMGYDIRYGLTRLRRLPGLAMSENDKLQIYIKLNKQSDDQNPLRKIGASDTNEQRLKSLLLAVHNFESIFRHLPAPSNRRYVNEVPHSWRVALLPILGFSELYKQYRFDEPWDSENNRKLIEKMPEIYRKKGASSSQGQTHFQLVVGNEAAFSENSITRFTDVTDGTSNTIAIVLASQSVPWTKPEDFSFPEKGFKELDPSHLVGLLDGNTVKLAPSMSDSTFSAMATRAGGEVAKVDP